MIKYTIAEIPPSNNKFIGRENRWEYQKIKKYWAELIFYTCIPRPIKPIEHSIVKIRYYFKDQRRRDCDNYSGKMILDGLVNAGIISDDSFKNIKLVLEAEFGCRNPKTEIEVIEIE